MDTTQLTFLLYLLLGQGVLLGLWSLGAGRAARWRGRPPGAAASAWRSTRVAFALFLLAGQAGLLLGWNALDAAWESADVVLRADVVVTLHFGFVLFVVGLQVLVLVGWPLRWAWTRNFWLRLAQVVCIEIVAGQSVVELECPLTSLERDLRGGLRPPKEGDDRLEPWELRRAQLHHLDGASPVARFCHNLLFYRIGNYYAPIAGGFGLLVLLTWLLVPPGPPGHSSISR